MGPTESCGSHINLVGPMWILSNRKECVKKCVASISHVYIYWNLECMWNLDVYLDVHMLLFYFKNLYWLCKYHEFSMDY